MEFSCYSTSIVLLVAEFKNKIGASLNSQGAKVRKYEAEFDISKVEFWIVFLHGDPQRKTDRDVENSDRVEWLRNRNLTRWQVQNCPEDTCEFQLEYLVHNLDAREFVFIRINYPNYCCLEFIKNEKSLMFGDCMKRMK